MNHTPPENLHAEDPVSPEVLEHYLRGDSSYSKFYRNIESDDVPAHLDAGVLEGARNAVKPKKFVLKRWTPLLAIAATGVLTISVVLQSGRQHTTPLSDTYRTQSEAIVTEEEATRSIQPPMLQLPAAPPPAAAEPAFAPAPKLDLAEAKAKSDDQLARLEDGVRPQESRAKERQADAQAAAAQTFPLKKESAPTLANSQAQGLVVSPTRESNSELDKVVVTGTYRRSSPEDAALPVDVVSQENLDRNARTETRRAGPRETVPAPSAQAPVQASKAAGDVTNSSVLEEAIVTGSYIQDKRVAAGPRGNVPATPLSSSDRTERKDEKSARESSPALWLTYIRDLRAEGKNAAADREWARFVKAYPNEIVDDDDTARPKKVKR